MLGDEFVASSERLREDLGGGGGFDGGGHALRKSKDPTTCRKARLSGAKLLRTSYLRHVRPSVTARVDLSSVAI